MFNMSAVSAAGAGRQNLVRIALTTVGALGMLFASTRTSVAQTSESAPGSWEFRITSGSFVPTGDQRNAVKSGQATAAQISWVLRPSLAITGTFAWARSRDLTSPDNPKLDVFMSDLGVESRPATWFANGPVSVRPFVGLGAGMRTYDYRKLAIDGTNNLAGYGAFGGELGMGRVALRLEVRDYVSGFKPLAAMGTSDTHNDVLFTAALSFNARRAPKN